MDLELPCVFRMNEPLLLEDYNELNMVIFNNFAGSQMVSVIEPICALGFIPGSVVRSVPRGSVRLPSCKD